MTALERVSAGHEIPLRATRMRTLEFLAAKTDKSAKSVRILESLAGIQGGALPISADA